MDLNGNRQAAARDLKRRLIVWNARRCELWKSWERLEKLYRKCFGPEGLPDPTGDIAERVAAVSDRLDTLLDT